MDAREFWIRYGPEESERVALAAGSKYSYFKHLVMRTRRPSATLAKRLVEADQRLTLTELLYPPEAPKGLPKREAA